jgi:hypothetical protein
LKPGYHFIGSRVETRRFQARFNLYSPTSVLPGAMAPSNCDNTSHDVAVQVAPHENKKTLRKHFLT